jgi:hypothetical protein
MPDGGANRDHILIFLMTFSNYLLIEHPANT